MKGRPLFIRRGYPLPVFDEAMEALAERRIETVVHTILGLPGETPEMMLDTVRYVSRTPAAGIKLQLLHILKNTDLAEFYTQTGFPVLSMEKYVDWSSAVLRSAVRIWSSTGSPETVRRIS